MSGSRADQRPPTEATSLKIAIYWVRADQRPPTQAKYRYLIAKKNSYLLYNRPCGGCYPTSSPVTRSLLHARNWPARIFATISYFMKQGGSNNEKSKKNQREFPLLYYRCQSPAMHYHWYCWLLYYSRWFMCTLYWEERDTRKEIGLDIV